MREIKFRGKTENGNWLVGDLMTLEHFVADSKSKFQIGDFKTGVVFDVNKDTVGQYTGLKDKNGKEIYEGDILQQIHYKFSNDEYGHKGFKKTIIQVFWDSKMAGFVFKVIKKTDTEMPKNYTEPYREVIGNIYDKPELLKEEHK